MSIKSLFCRVTDSILPPKEKLEWYVMTDKNDFLNTVDLDDLRDTQLESMKHNIDWMEKDEQRSYILSVEHSQKKLRQQKYLDLINKNKTERAKYRASLFEWRFRMMIITLSLTLICLITQIILKVIF